MKIICALPDNNFYLWQVLVQINNFNKIGVGEDLIYIVGCQDPNNPNPNLVKMMNSSLIKAKFYLYPDKRQNSVYPSSLRPNILSQHFKAVNYAITDVFFYIDPDIVFTKPIDLQRFETDQFWYVSDTRSYIDSNYIRSKSEQLFTEMCGIVGVAPERIIALDPNAGGAQYIMKNINYCFWDKVEKDSEALYKHMNATAGIYNPQHPIQAWTADMWAVLWNCIYFGGDAVIDKELDFSWATDSINRWSETSIFHNAGAFGNNKYFCKADHQASPWNKTISCEQSNCSFNYLQEVLETYENYNDLTW